MKFNSIALAVASTFLITACGGSSDSNPEPTPEQPVNSAPTDITLSASTVSENKAGVTIGTLSATDADANDSFTFTTSNDDFVINGNELALNTDVTFDFETTQSATVPVTVTDAAGASYTKDFTISINDEVDIYAFDSAFVAGESAVSYSGQTARHLLINDLNILIGNNFGDANSLDTSTFPDKAAVIAALESYFDVADYEALSARALLTTTSPEAEQTTLAEVSSSEKNLVGKIAGADEVGQHKDWATEFAGWGSVGDTTPTGLVRTFFDMLGDNVQATIDGEARFDPFGGEITTPYLTEDGRDLKQLIQKFLLMSVAYSQGADDYLDNDIEGKGLLSDHTDTGENYTALEHQFDEGFGYFGAARNYLDYSDAEIAGKGGRDDWQGYHDTDGDGDIDFTAEYNFGQSTNAAKRDLGATVATDLTADAMNAFLQGRALLNETAGSALTDAQMEELVDFRDTALSAWEQSIAATVIHYINDTNADLAAIGSEEFNYSDLAKHWSEMKGFALGLQFNPHSPVTDEQFVELHNLMGTAPVLTGDVEAYQANLLEARAILEAAYQFDSETTANW